MCFRAARTLVHKPLYKVGKGNAMREALTANLDSLQHASVEQLTADSRLIKHAASVGHIRTNTSVQRGYGYLKK